MPETCPRRIVGESARTRLRDFRGELDLWTERGPVSFVPRSFQAMGKLRCVMGEGRRGGKRKNDTLTRFDVSRSGISSLDYIRIGVCIIIDNNVSVGAWNNFFSSDQRIISHWGGEGGWRSWLVVVKKNFLRVRDDTMLFLRFNHTNGGQKNEAGFEI